MRLNKVAGIAASTFFTGALVLGMASTASAAPGLDLGSLTGSIGGGDDCSTVVSTPGNTQGWGVGGEETAATYGAVSPAGPLGADALKFVQSDKATSWYKTTNVKLSTLLDGDKLTPIGFDYLTNGAAPTLQLRILGANYQTDGDGFASIVWSPAAGDGTKWQTAAPGSSNEFWVTRDIRAVAGVNDDKALPRQTKTTLANIIAMNPNATLIEYGVQQTKENAATNVAVDRFVFGCTTTDFETKTPGPLGSLADIFGGLS